MSADMRRDMQSSSWRLAVDACPLGSAIACATMSKMPATQTAVSTRFTRSHPNRRRAPLHVDCILYRKYAVYPGSLHEGHTGIERQRCPTTPRAPRPMIAEIRSMHRKIDCARRAGRRRCDRSLLSGCLQVSASLNNVKRRSQCRSAAGLLYTGRCGKANPCCVPG